MAAATTHTFPRHTHDQYGMGVIDSGGHASSSGRGQVEAGPGSLIFVNPGEVHDGRPIGRRARSWRMLYLDPTLMEELRADVLDGTNPSFTFAAPAFVDENLRRLFDAAFAHATAKEGFHDAMGCETALLHLAARVEVNATARSRSPVGPAPCIRRVRTNATIPAKDMMHRSARFVVIAQLIFVAQQPEPVRLDDRAPQAGFETKCAVALRGPRAQVNIGLVANCAAVATSGVGLQHCVSPRSNRLIA
jgi:hypothetical protein